MERIKGKLGFGCMRLPMKGEEIDIPAFSEMVDAFLDAGFNYFDTARVYHKGGSEPALKAALTSRYPREKYVLTTKLSGSCFEKREDIRPLFESQLASLGVDYLDFYLVHAVREQNYTEKYGPACAFEEAFALKAEGKIRHVGFSYHGTPEFLDKLLDKYPEAEIVQLQFNYLDFEDENVASRRCLEVCEKHGKPVLVMEPVKGGQLAKLPEDAAAILAGLGGGSPASYALRFAAGFDAVKVVLSGMGNMDMMRDNIATMKDFSPLDPKELGAVARVAGVLRGKDLIACTGCRYCVDGCPAKIVIPEVFAAKNAEENFARLSDRAALAAAAKCLRCGKCEKICPQGLPIRALLESIAKDAGGKA